MLKRIIACALLLVSAYALAGCGQKGPLTLPVSAHITPAQAAAQAAGLDLRPA